jgi:hypothetical protein
LLIVQLEAGCARRFYDSLNGRELSGARPLSAALASLR